MSSELSLQILSVKYLPAPLFINFLIILNFELSL